MDSFSSWFERVRGAAAALLETLIDNLPNLLAGVALLFLGWLVARLARTIVQRFGNGLNRFLARVLRRGNLSTVRLSVSVLHAGSTVLYWVVLIYFAAGAARVAHLAGVATWLDGIVEYVPSMLAGGLIIVAGYVISTLVRDMVASSMSSDGVSQAHAAASFAQGATFLIAVVIGLEQMGIDATFLIVLIAIILGGVFLSLALAFGLGARTLVSNLIAANEVRRSYQPGQRVCIGSVDGEILELTSTSIIIETGDGRVNVPARSFQERITLLRVPQA